MTAQFWAPHFSTDMELAGACPEKVKGLEGKSYEEHLRKIDVFILERRRRLRSDLTALCNCLRGVCIKIGVGLFSQAGDKTSNRTRENGHKLHQGRLR